jgi:hypothetical protein
MSSNNSIFNEQRPASPHLGRVKTELVAAFTEYPRLIANKTSRLERSTKDCCLLDRCDLSALESLQISFVCCLLASNADDSTHSSFL